LPELTLFFELEKADGVDLDRVAQALREQLEQLPEVEDADAEPERARFTGLEVAAGIAAAVAIVRGGRELVEELRKLIERIKQLHTQLNAEAAQPEARPQAEQPSPSPQVINVRITNIIVDTGAREVPLSELTEDDLAEMARTLSEE